MVTSTIFTIFIFFYTLAYASCLLFRFDTVEWMEDVLTGLKVLAFDENCIRLSLKTYLPQLEGNPSLVRVDYITETNELNHELLIEVIKGSMKLKNV